MTDGADEDRIEDPALRPVRFNLRALLWISTTLAVLCAIAAPWVRSLDSEQQRGLVRILLLLLSGAIAGEFWRRHRRKRWGRLLLFLEAEKQLTSFQILMSLGTPVCLTLFFVLDDDAMRRPDYVLHALALLYGGWIGKILTNLIVPGWRAGVALFEVGVLTDEHGLWKWPHVHVSELGRRPGDRSVKITYENRNYQYFDRFAVPDEKWDAALHILSARAASFPTLTADSDTNLPQLPQPPHA